ncbi:Asp23/Gls24 family envelope stress response protein [Natronosporangium hydrolyticum]|uniref:Asp23/Gls24 family envelope stress response protein n=1 Tax=Natronosporangium hydrolyticum TaxID=2811111 RepID=A0A895YL71_9ACTN|nr:Asp23/Gls24 family envelope stress response protein [Natronosporangium hydrolyticum]QSB15416.1 Asp23/Gls24 family envelope stress response protein [Natronosporangium hydrolyticum]
MTTYETTAAVVPERAEPVPAAEAGGPADRAPEHRGRTEIAGRVLERIAARALTEVEQAGGSARRVFGVPLGRDEPGRDPQVSAEVDGDLATLRMSISVVYPTPIRQIAATVRERVSTRVSELTGLEVRQVDITVAALSHAGQSVGSGPARGAGQLTGGAA